MAISAVLFDKDGTLIDYHQTWTPINREAALFAASGDPELADKLLVAGGWDPSTQRVVANSALAAGTAVEIAEVWHAHGSTIDLPRLATAIDNVFSKGMTGAVPVTDLRELFAKLKRSGLTLGIASSDNIASVNALAEHNGLTELLDFSVGYDSGHGTKPGPGMLLAFCAATGHPPANTAVVGDNLHDMDMAAAGGAGLRIAVLTGTGTRADLEPHCDHCIDDISQLHRVLPIQA